VVSRLSFLTWILWAWRRVTRLANFRPLGDCFLWAVFKNCGTSQGFQMVYFQTKNSNLGNFRVLQWKRFLYFTAIWSILQTFGTIYGHLVYLWVIWCIYFPPFLYVCITNKNLATLELAQICVLLFPIVVVTFWFWQKRVGLHTFGRFFHKLIWSPWPCVNVCNRVVKKVKLFVKNWYQFLIAFQFYACR
jgi:hypothetical protein